jgi:hypothetical protein
VCARSTSFSGSESHSRALQNFLHRSFSALAQQQSWRKKSRANLFFITSIFQDILSYLHSCSNIPFSTNAAAADIAAVDERKKLEHSRCDMKNLNYHQQELRAHACARDILRRKIAK